MVLSRRDMSGHKGSLLVQLLFPKTLPPPPRAFGRTKSLRLGLDSTQLHCCLIAGGIPGQPAGKIGRCSAPPCS